MLDLEQGRASAMKTLNGEGRVCHYLFCLVFSTEKGVASVGSSDGSGGSCGCGQ